MNNDHEDLYLQILIFTINHYYTILTIDLILSKHNFSIHFISNRVPYDINKDNVNSNEIFKKRSTKRLEFISLHFYRVHVMCIHIPREIKILSSLRKSFS